MFVRPALSGDVAAITTLYNELGVATTASYDLAPVTTANRLAWLDDHHAHGWPVLVAEDADGAVSGFAAFSAFRPKAGYDRTVEHSVYVDAGRQGKGVGHALMTALIGQARRQQRHAMIGVVDATNAASIEFHRSLGFVIAGVLPEVGRKFGRWLDVTLLVLLLDDEGSHHD